jgi:hypothetical protein
MIQCWKCYNFSKNYSKLVKPPGKSLKINDLFSELSHDGDLKIFGS